MIPPITNRCERCNFEGDIEKLVDIETVCIGADYYKRRFYLCKKCVEGLTTVIHEYMIGEIQVNEQSAL